MTAHGYVSYTQGCRCEICRKAKAAYMRDRRSRKQYGPRRIEIVDGERCIVALGLSRHGTRYAYEERGCRCPSCRRAHNRSDHRRAKAGAA